MQHSFYQFISKKYTIQSVYAKLFYLIVMNGRSLRYLGLRPYYIFQMIEFTVNDFELEFQKTCSNDYLEIIDVNHNRIIGRYCGHINSGIPASSGNDVRLKLRTNRLGHFKGFSINYEAVSPPSPSSKSNGPLARYVKLRTAHAPGMPGMFSPPLTSKKTAS